MTDRGRFDKSYGVGYLGRRMSVRLDPRLSHVPAIAGFESLGRYERMLAATNAPRGS